MSYIHCIKKKLQTAKNITKMRKVSWGQRLDNDREDGWGGWGKSGVSSRWQTCWWLRRGAGRYLESLPVGPNQSDSVLTPGLFLQSPELPASLFGGGREETESRNKWSRRRWEGEEVDTVLPEVSNIKCTHTLHTSTVWSLRDCKITALLRQPPETNMELWVMGAFIWGTSGRQTELVLWQLWVQKKKRKSHISGCQRIQSLPSKKQHSNATTTHALATQEVMQRQQAACGVKHGPWRKKLKTMPG